MREYQKHLSGHVNFIANQKVIRRLPQTSDSIAPNADLFLTPHHPLQPADLGLFGFPLLSLQLLPPPGRLHLEMIFLFSVRQTMWLPCSPGLVPSPTFLPDGNSKSPPAEGKPGGGKVRERKSSWRPRHIVLYSLGAFDSFQEKKKGI